MNQTTKGLSGCLYLLFLPLILCILSVKPSVPSHIMLLGIAVMLVGVWLITRSDPKILSVPISILDTLLTLFIQAFTWTVAFINSLFLASARLIIRMFKRPRQPENILSLDLVDSMSGLEFEQYIKVLLIASGYKVMLTKTTGDSGVDLIAIKDKLQLAIQCKRHKGRVGNSAIQQVYSGAAIYGCNKRIVITNSYFTNQAIRDGKQLGVELVDRDGLNRWLMNL